MSVSLSRRLLKVVDSARVLRMRGVNRAQFIRDALAEKLARMGIEVPDEDVIAPDRAGCALNEASAPPPVEGAPKKVNYRAALKADAKKRKRKDEA